MLYLLPQIIEQSAQRTPDKAAFTFKDQAITYAALADRVNQLANTLIDLGVQRGDRVGIYMHKQLDCATAIHGIMQAGAAYVPLDPTAPVSRTALITRDCDIRVIVTDETKRRQLSQLATEQTPLTALIGPEEQGDLPFITRSCADVTNASKTRPQVNIIEQDLAYIIYSSGSTGTPKGIMHTHASGLAYARMAADLYSVQPDDRLSNFPPLHFDQSTFDYFSGPLVGATTVIIPDEVRIMPASLSQLIEDEQLTIWYSVPYALIQMLLRGALYQRNLSSLRWIIYGGEPFPRKHLAALQKLMPNAKFSNNFGPAETNQITHYTIPSLAQDPDSEAPIPVGVVCANMQALVLDDDDQPLSAAELANGESGELLMRTPTMMQGYWNRPDLNAAGFYYTYPEKSRTTSQTAEMGQEFSSGEENPVGIQERWYRTGDLVQLLPDGNYHFLGRKDRQVKTRGFRVELDEIEAALLTHDAVEEAAAFPVPDGDGSSLIKAAVITKAGAELTKSNLLNHLMQNLPRYAIPTAIDIMPTFPRTTSGKIDRRALREEAINSTA